MKNLFFLLPFFFLSISAFSRPVHEFHASIGDIKYNAESKAFEVALRMFTDDLSAALSKQLGTKLKVDPNGKTNEQIADYTMRRFGMIGVKNQPMQLNFVGVEVEDDVVWVYLEVPIGNFPLQSLKVRNTVLMDQYEDQVNTVNVFLKEEPVTLVFRKGVEVQPIP
jgi:hypothetical protein